MLDLLHSSYFIDTLALVILLIIWHFYFQIPKQFMLIEGKVESCNLQRQRLRKKITFLQNDGTRIAFTRIYMGQALEKQIEQYQTTALAGRFCLMKQFGFMHCFAYADNTRAIALSSDMYFPKTFMQKLVAILKYFVIAMMIVFIYFALFISSKSVTILQLLIVFSYLIYFNFISNHPKKIYAKQVDLLKQANIPEPII